MDPEYAEKINTNLALLNSAMESVGIAWEWEPTGGGCDAFIHNISGSSEYGDYYLITVEDDASIPTSPTEWESLAVGLYNEDSEMLGDVFIGSLSDVVELFGGK